MRSEFEKWFKTSRSYLILKEANYFNLDLFEFNESYKRYVHNGIQIAFEAWQHQQFKVDELQVKLNGAEERASTCLEYKDKYRAERDELQKRVDAVKTLIDEYRDPPTEDKTFRHALSIVAYELEQALKGGEG